MLVMPFWLCNAPATFKRVMDSGLYKKTHVESYVDDILIFPPDPDSHLSHHEVLKHLEVAGVQLVRRNGNSALVQSNFSGTAFPLRGEHQSLYTLKGFDPFLS